MEFEHAMLQYIMICDPFACSLWCFEAANANVSDIFIFWLGIAAYLTDIFSKPELTRIPISLSNKLTQVFNTPYNEFFKNEFYFVTFSLDPCKPVSTNIIFVHLISIAGYPKSGYLKSTFSIPIPSKYRYQNFQINAILQYIYSSQDFSQRHDEFNYRAHPEVP
jgi:hypothetical protein